jgi:pimeloyl-ACP methyl ester carboxylesterase
MTPRTRFEPSIAHGRKAPFHAAFVPGEVGFDRFHLVDYSGGGASSLAFAAAHLERLASLALIEPACLGNEGLGADEQAVWREFERIMDLPPECHGEGPPRWQSPVVTNGAGQGGPDQSCCMLAWI